MALFVIAACFLIVLGALAGLVVKLALLTTLLTGLVALLTFVSSSSLTDTVDKLECDSLVQSTLDMAASESRSAKLVKAVLSKKTPAVSYLDGSNGSIRLIKGAVEDIQILFVDVNNIPQGQVVVTNKGPIIAFSSDPSKMPTHELNLVSETLVSLCQKNLTSGDLNLKTPLVVLDQETETTLVPTDGALNFNWGKVAVSEGLGVYTFGQVKDVIREMILNKKVESLVDIRPGITFGTPVVANLNQETESDITDEGVVESEFVVVEPKSTQGEKFEAQYTRDCNLIADCEITVNEEQMQQNVSSFFDSKGGRIEKDFSKEVPLMGTAEIKVIASNPKVEFVEADDVSKMQTTIDLDVSTNNNLVQTKILDGQIIRAVVQSSLIYDDNTWRFYAHEPKVVEILFSKPKRLLKVIRGPLVKVVNAIAGEVLKKTPVFDLDKSDITGTDAVGYALDSVEIEGNKLVVKLSIF